MSLFTAALADFCAAHHWVVSDTELRALGITKARTHALVDADILEPVHRGVHRLRHAPLTVESRCRAVCLAAPDAVITGRAAGKLWGVRRIPKPDRIEIRAPWFSNRFRDAGVELRRCPKLPDVDITERDDGIRLVSPPRLIFDLGAVLSDLDLESVIEEVLDKEWCTIGTIRDTCARLFHTSRPGSVRVARVLSRRPDWMPTADSHLEVELFDALRAAGVRGLERQFPVDLPGGFTIHSDVAVPALRWLIPVDHVWWHGGRIQSQRDKRADRQARMCGWNVDRVTDDDIRDDLAGVVAELLAIYARLSATFPPAS